MFKNRAFQIKVVQDETRYGYTAPPQRSIWTPATISQFAQEQVLGLAVVIAGLYAIKVALDTTSEIAIKKTTTRR